MSGGERGDLYVFFLNHCSNIEPMFVGSYREGLDDSKFTRRNISCQHVVGFRTPYGVFQDIRAQLQARTETIQARIDVNHLRINLLTFCLSKYVDLHNNQKPTLFSL